MGLLGIGIRGWGWGWGLTENERLLRMAFACGKEGWAATNFRRQTAPLLTMQRFTHIEKVVPMPPRPKNT